jgi:hypothetical protein
VNVLRALASEAFDALDRGEGIAITGNEQLADFISKLGRRVAKKDRSSDAYGQERS